MTSKNIIVKNPKGWTARDFQTNPLGEKFVGIIYGKRGKLGKFLKLKTRKIIRLPKNVRITKIENNLPRVGYVTISVRKK